MPVDAKDAMLMAGLSSPTPPPPQSVSNFQNISGVGMGDFGMPFTSGSTIQNSGTTVVNTANPGEVRSRDFNEVGSNVAGLYGRNFSPEGSKAFIPEAEDPLEKQTNEFIEAFEEGHTKETDADIWSGGWSGKGNEKEAYTMGAARQAKRDDRKQDREVRQSMRKDMWEDLAQKYEDAGMSKGEANRKARRESRRAKRSMRQAQHAQRKESWETFKGERDLSQQDEALKMENKYP